MIWCFSNLDIVLVAQFSLGPHKVPGPLNSMTISELPTAFTLCFPERSYCVDFERPPPCSNIWIDRFETFSFLNCFIDSLPLSDCTKQSVDRDDTFSRTQECPTCQPLGLSAPRQIYSLRPPVLSLYPIPHRSLIQITQKKSCTIMDTSNPAMKHSPPPTSFFDVVLNILATIAPHILHTPSFLPPSHQPFQPSKAFSSVSFYHPLQPYPRNLRGRVVIVAFTTCVPLPPVGQRMFSRER